MKILGFYHICLINNWEALVSEQVNSILKSNLYVDTEKIIVGCLGPLSLKRKLQVILPKKFNVEFYDENINLFEIPTIRIMQIMAKQEKFYSWYIHTKGVFSKTLKKINTVEKWRKMMEHFVIDKYTKCLEMIKLDNCDACGTEAKYYGFPKIIENQLVYTNPTYHFSGNFWWSKSQYIKHLPDIQEKWIEFNRSRYVAEAFIGMAPKPRLYSFLNSYNNLYDNVVDEKIYNKINEPKLFRLINLL